MSGYRRYSRSRYGYRRRRYYGYRYRRYGMSTARKANIAYRSTRKMVKRQEVKTHEIVSNNFAINSSLVNFNTIAKVPQGNTEDSRIGNSISPTSLRIKLFLHARLQTTLDPVSTPFTKLFRIIIAVWKGEGDPSLGDILDTTDSPNLIVAPKNDQYKYNSKILYDKVHKIDHQIQMKTVPITIKRSLRRYPVTLQGATSPVTYRMNGYHMWIIPDSIQTLPSNVQINGHMASRLVFKDN